MVLFRFYHEISQAELLSSALIRIGSHSEAWTSRRDHHTF